MRKKAGIRRWKTKSHTHRVRGDINARCNNWHSFSTSFSTALRNHVGEKSSFYEKTAMYASLFFKLFYARLSFNVNYFLKKYLQFFTIKVSLIISHNIRYNSFIE